MFWIYYYTYLFSFSLKTHNWFHYRRGVNQIDLPILIDLYLYYKRAHKHVSLSPIMTKKTKKKKEN